MSGERDDGDKVFTKMEFAVQMTCASCEQAVNQSLAGIPGIKSVYVNLHDEVVLVESCLPSRDVQWLLEGTGRLVVFRGHGGAGESSPEHHGAAVTVLKSYGQGKWVGLARLVQATPTQCVADATVDGLPEGQYKVKVHEFGDLSNGCESCGEEYSTGTSEDSSTLGTLTVDSDGRGTLQSVSDQLRVWELIGRSLVVHSSQQNRLMCGIVARSAGLFQNSKKLCTCDGVTIWDEARKNQSTSDSVKASL